MCTLACSACWEALQWVPADADDGVYAAAFKNSFEAARKIPHTRLRIEYFLANSQTVWQENAWPLVAQLFEPHDILRFLQVAALFGRKKQIALLTSHHFTAPLKQQLLHWLFFEHDSTPPYRACRKELYARHSPLKNQCSANVFQTELLFYAYRAKGYTPPHGEAGHAIERYIEANMPQRFEENPDTAAALLSGCPYQQKGRTLVMASGEQTLHYKFQKKAEPLCNLAREGLLHAFRSRTQAGQAIGFMSQLPCEPHFFRLPERHWQGLPRPLLQQAEISEEDGRLFINVYRYSASPRYTTYAHTADTDNPCKPCARPEQGLLAACHDIGVLTGMGLVPTSSIDAFHDVGSSRRWLFFHTLLGFGGNDHPGTFGAWNSTATDFPDFGHDGLRDMGDYQRFNQITAHLNASDSSAHFHAEPVMQRLAFMEMIGESMLAAVLLRSRLCQQFPWYHYRSADAVRQTELFVENILNHFVAGFYQIPVQQERLRHLMDITADHYQRWLHRCAQEICYWTAAQPERATPEQPAFNPSSSDYDHTDCYARHVEQTQCLSPELYPDILHRNPNPMLYPESFHNMHDRLNLGAHNRAFPLMALSSGLTLMLSALLRTEIQGNRPVN